MIEQGFTYEMTLGGAAIAEIDGTAMIECGRDGWEIDKIILDGVTDEGRTTVELPGSDPMFAKIADWVEEHYRDAIDEEWAVERKLAKEQAKYDASNQ